MPDMPTTRITDATYKQAKPADKAYTISDSEATGLAMLVHPNGSKYWILRYRFAGKREKLHLGTYPDVPLHGYAMARTESDGQQWIPGARDIAHDVRRLVAAG